MRLLNLRINFLFIADFFLTNYTATCLPSRKLSKLNEPDMQDTAGEAEMSS